MTLAGTQEAQGTRVPALPDAEADSPACSCATGLDQVEAAWRLVYQSYLDAGLIEGNPWCMHATPAAVGPHSCVIAGQAGGTTACTMTLSCDNEAGLALDSVCRAALDDLRERGRRLVEVGMLAVDARVRRGARHLFGMMRWAIHYGLHAGATDILVGVHPRHTGFYARHYGFEAFAPETAYPLVRNHPVVVLRLRLREALSGCGHLHGIADALEHPIPASAFAGRFMFDPTHLRGSTIAAFLAAKGCLSSPSYLDLLDWRARQDSNLRPVT